MDRLDTTAWLHSNEQTGFSDPTTCTETGHAASIMNYDFSFSTLSRPLDIYRQPLHFPSSNLPCIGGDPPTRPKSRVSLACIPCRRRHAKCDAAMPVCSQCQAGGRVCSYIQSRRGRTQHGREEQHQRAESGRQRYGTDISQQEYGRSMSESSSTWSASTSDSWHSHVPSPVQSSSAFEGHGATSSTESRFEYSAAQLDLYYNYFHNAHPIVLPRHFFNHRLETNRYSLRHLLPVMEFIGSLFAAKTIKDDLRSRVESILLLDNLPETGFTVQALLILAIAVQSCNEFSRGREIMNRAIGIALNINLQSRSFATVNGEGSPVLEESWRRTWWLLYLADGMFAGIQQCTELQRCSEFSLFKVAADVHIPCEEAEYQSGNIPKPRTLEEYNAREFSGEEISFSSFAYLIDLSHSLGVILALGTEPGEPFEPGVVAADAILINWGLYLPRQKHLIMGGPGEIDEILFQAHILCNTLKVYLHRPRSQLFYSPVERISKCATPPLGASIAEQQGAYDIHTAKALEASEVGIGLFTLPGPIIKHTPMVICALTMSILAQLSACRLKLRAAEYTACRNRVRLGLGVIKTFGETWPIGRITVKELQVIARDSLSLPTAMTIPIP